MTVKFKILNKELDQHSVVVRYYTDTFTEDSLATSYINDANGNRVIDRNPDGSPKRCQTDYNINIWNVAATQITANSAALVDYISKAAPFDWFDLKEAVMNVNVDTNMALVDALIGVEFKTERPIIIVDTPNPAVDLTEAEIQNLIDSIINSNTAPTT